jgi:hypothetical protein
MIPKKMMHAVLAFPLMLLLIATATPLLQAQKQAKDQQEYELITKAFGTQPSAALMELLDQWKEKYPETAFDIERIRLYMASYQATNQVDKVVATAKEILAKAPADFAATVAIARATRYLGKTDEGTLSDGAKAATALLGGVIAKQFAAKPAQVAQEQWDEAKAQVAVISHQLLGWIAMQRKDYKGAEASFKQALSLIETTGSLPLPWGRTSYELAQVVQAQANPDKTTLTLYLFARAAVYDGLGALPAENRETTNEYIRDLYVKYAGTEEGLDDLFATAKQSALPPAGFPEVKDANRRKYEADVAFKKSDPLRYEFVQLKKSLAQPTNPTWGRLKGKLTPKFRLFVVSATPARAPNKLTLTSTRGGNAEVTVNLTNRLRSAPARGSRVTFQGVAATLTRSPFMLVLNDSKTE